REPDEGAPRTLVRLRGDEASPRQDPPDRRDRRDRLAPVVPLQVHRDRLGTRIQPAVAQLLAELDDLVFQSLRGPVRAPVWSSRSRLESLLSFSIEASAELVDIPRS